MHQAFLLLIIYSDAIPRLGAVATGALAIIIECVLKSALLADTPYTKKPNEKTIVQKTCF